jgi:hypothetical protein
MEGYGHYHAEFVKIDGSARSSGREATAEFKDTHSPSWPTEWSLLKESGPREPWLPILDSHHHLLTTDVYRYRAGVRRDLRAGGHDVRASVFVECPMQYRADAPPHLRPVGETEFVRRVDQSGFVAGIIGFVDVCSPRVVEVLDAHVAAGAGRFRGVRYGTEHDPSPDVRPMHAARARSTGQRRLPRRTRGRRRTRACRSRRGCSIPNCPRSPPSLGTCRS